MTETIPESENAPYPIARRLLGKYNEVRLKHEANAWSPIVCNAGGKTTEAKLLHLLNASFLMICNESGKVTDVRLAQEQNTYSSITVSLVVDKSTETRPDAWNA